MSKLIEQQGLVVINNVTGMPTYNNEPYISPFAVIALCHRGSAKGEYDMQPIEFSFRDLSFMRLGHIIRTHKVSADYVTSLVVMSEKFFENVEQVSSMSFFAHNHYDNPVHHLTNRQYRQMCDAFKLLDTVSGVGTHYRDKMTLNVVNTITMLSSEFSPVVQEGQGEGNRHLSSRFNDAIVEHCSKEHDVSFYADLFCLSPKYFSSLIKAETGKGASHWIDNYLTLQAKQLLVDNPELNIQQIAARLGFSEQSSFSRFFQNKTGLWPTEYRKEMLTTPRLAASWE